MSESNISGGSNFANLSVVPTTLKSEPELARELQEQLLAKCKELLPLMNEASRNGLRVEIGFSFDQFGRNVIGRCALVKELAA